MAIVRSVSAVLLGSIVTVTLGALVVAFGIVLSAHWPMLLAVPIIATGLMTSSAVGGWIAARLGRDFPIGCGVLSTLLPIVCAVALAPPYEQAAFWLFLVFTAGGAFGAHIASTSSPLAMANREAHDDWLPTEILQGGALALVGLLMALMIAEHGAPFLF